MYPDPVALCSVCVFIGVFVSNIQCVCVAGFAQVFVQCACGVLSRGGYRTIGHALHFVLCVLAHKTPLIMKDVCVCVVPVYMYVCT